MCPANPVFRYIWVQYLDHHRPRIGYFIEPIGNKSGILDPRTLIQWNDVATTCRAVFTGESLNVWYQRDVFFQQMEFKFQIAVSGGKCYILFFFQRYQRNRDHVLSTILSKEDSNFPLICNEWSLNINTHDLFTTDYQDYQAKPGNMSVPVKSWQTPEGKWEPSLVGKNKWWCTHSLTHTSKSILVQTGLKLPQLLHFPSWPPLPFPISSRLALCLSFHATSEREISLFLI